MNRYFVTGGTGFIGREIVRQLISLPSTEYVMCLTRGHRTNLIGHPKVRYWLGDVTEFNYPSDRFTHLIHGAAEANDLTQPDKHSYYYSIVQGTERVMRWAANMEILNRVFLSSGAVSRETFYGQAKRQSEFLCNYYGNTKIARVFSVIGEEMPLNGQFAVGKFVWDAINSKKVRFYGGKSVRTYLHVSDCVNWILQIMNHGLCSHPYDVAGNEPILISDLADMVSEIWGVGIEKITGPDREDFYLPDTSDSQRLGCFQSMNTRQSLEKVHAFLCNTHA